MWPSVSLTQRRHMVAHITCLLWHEMMKKYAVTHAKTDKKRWFYVCKFTVCVQLFFLLILCAEQLSWWCVKGSGTVSCIAVAVMSRRFECLKSGWQLRKTIFYFIILNFYLLSFFLLINLTYFVRERMKYKLNQISRHRIVLLTFLYT